MSAGIHTGRVWLDVDGIHVWVEHDCGPRRNVTLLPHPTWAMDASGAVSPSIHCQDCGFHEFMRTE